MDGSEMNVYALVFTIGISSGHRELIGIYNDCDKLEEAMNKHMQQHYYNRQHYSVHEIELNKEENIIIAEW